MRLSLTFLLHSGPKTFFQPTVAALISLVLVDHTNSLKAASVNVVLPNASPKETFTAITTRSSIMLARGFIATNQAGPVLAIISCTKRVNIAQLNTCYSLEQHVHDKYRLQAIKSCLLPLLLELSACFTPFANLVSVIDGYRKAWFSRKHCVPKRNPLRYIYSQTSCTLNSRSPQLSLEKMSPLMAATTPRRFRLHIHMNR